MALDQIKNRRLFILKLLFKAGYYKLRSDEVAMMSIVADGFLELGGVYVKFLQGILLQLPVMKLWKGDRRFDVYENVPVDSIDIHLFLKDYLSKEQLAKLSNISSEPFASGSFGQVYKARLVSGERVIIKVLRPNINKFLKKDLRLIRIVSRLISSVFTNWSLDLKTLVSGFVKSTLAEIDYKSEARFAQESYDYYASNDKIVIPKTYLELSNRHIIVQEYIGGISLAQLLRDNNVKK